MLFLKKIDWVIVACVCLLVAAGIAGFYGINEHAASIIKRQTLFGFLGLCTMLFIARIDYRIFKNYSLVSLAPYFITVVLLCVTLASARIRGISAWIVLFNRYQVQPSEFAKLALLILLAKYFSQKHAEIYNMRHIIASGMYAAVPAVLTLIQPDLGSMVVFGVLWVGMLFFSGIRRRHLYMIFMVAVMMSSLAWFFVFKQYQKDRIIAFINPYTDARGIGYNTIQAETTVGSGRLFGSFFSRGHNVVVLVPEPYTDFAFGAFAQRFGLFGVVGFLAVFLVLLFRMAAIGSRSRNNFAKLFTLGFLTILVTHFTINVGMNVGLLPITGIPLSFLSYGGSHLVMVMVGVGIVQSIRIYG